MREMRQDEIQKVCRHAKWATICTVMPDGGPYAVEATPYRDGEDICFMINPRGGTARNVRDNPNVLLKFTLTSRSLSWWAGVSVFGLGRFDTDPEAIRRGFASLGRIMGRDYDRAGERFAANPDPSPLFRVEIREMTGRCSSLPEEGMFEAEGVVRDDA